MNEALGDNLVIVGAAAEVKQSPVGLLDHMNDAILDNLVALVQEEEEENEGQILPLKHSQLLPSIDGQMDSMAPLVFEGQDDDEEEEEVDSKDVFMGMDLDHFLSPPCLGWSEFRAFSLSLSHFIYFC